MSDDEKPTDDLTLRILKGIRGTLGEHGKRLDEHDKRFDQIDRRFDDHDRRFDEVTTELHALRVTVDKVHTLLVDRLDLRDRVARVEQDVAELKERL